MPINESSQLSDCRNYITPILLGTHNVLQVCTKSVADFGTQHYCWGSLNHCQWDKATKLECWGTILPVRTSKQSHWFAMGLSAPWAPCSCVRELLWVLPGSTLKALNSYPGKIYSKLNTRVTSQQSISSSAEQKETILLPFLFLLHIFRCSSTTKQARSAPPLMLAWSADRSKRSGL